MADHDRRPLLHLDSGAASRSSAAVVDAVRAHLELESQEGAYVAATMAGPEVERARRDLATLLGTTSAGIAFTESATAALRLLLEAWPLPSGTRVAVPPATWGPNLTLLERSGLRVELLAVDDDGVVDLEALQRSLAADPPGVLLLDHVASHRQLVQPVAEVVRLAHDAGVPVWVDVAQGLGHVDVRSGADAMVATSRKWLAGPRGVGLLAVAERALGSLVAPPSELESSEAFVAGRVALGVAVSAHLAAGPTEVHQRLRAVGESVRAMAADLRGWSVVRPAAPGGSITALAPTAGQDVEEVRERLLTEHRVLTTASLPWRAPRDPAAVPALRLSGHVGTSAADLERLAPLLSAPITRTSG